jgi:hypothetical protein
VHPHRRALGEPPLVGVGDHLAGALDVERALLQGVRIPIAARGIEEVTAGDVEGAGQGAERIDHRVDHRAAEQRGVPGHQLFASRDLQPHGGPAIDGVVLLSP